MEDNEPPKWAILLSIAAAFVVAYFLVLAFPGI
jgi:hypothetical protein